MLQQEKPEDFVIATGITTPVRDFVIMAFSEVGIELEFAGHGDTEVAMVKSCSNPDYQLPVGSEIVAVDPNYYRPTEVELLIGNPTKAKEKLGWEPGYTLPMLVKEMVASDLEIFKKEKLLKEHGFEIFHQYE
jgi:GDPmannose 4,6-dehydratase